MNNLMMKKNKLPKFLLPLGLAIFAFVLVKVIAANPPESKRGKPSKAAKMTVATQTVLPQAYQVMVNSFGKVSPRTQSVLYAQVSGQIIKVSEQFRSGGFFNKGDVLVHLDARDYLAEVNIAKASYVSATQTLQEEEARVQQAKADWQRLGNGSPPSDLVLRKPQLEAAKAKMLSAQAQLDKANLALERTKIIAPYAGRILSKHADLGQVVSGNTALANIYATDYVEVRLPIKNKDLVLINLPEEFHREALNSASNSTINTTSPNANTLKQAHNVSLRSDLSGEQQWQAALVRTEGAIDQSSQQLYVVAQIAQPYDRNAHKGQSQIKIGQYVTAEIIGRIADDALVIPSSAIYQGSYVYVVDKKGLLKRKDITLGWQNGIEAIVSKGLNAGDEIVLTPLGQVNSGTAVAIEGQNNVAEKKNKPQKEMSAKRLEKLTKKAKEKGITVDELLAQRKAKKGEH